MEKKRVSLDIAQDLHRRLKAKVADEGTTISGILTRLIGQWVGEWGERRQTYTVQQGDTLYSIARRFYDDPNKYRVIASFNDISAPYAISVGQKLLIPEPKKEVKPPPPVPPELPLGESPYIFGLHDRGGEHLMEEAGKTGWVLITETVDTPPGNYLDLARKGHGVIVRLNHGYSPKGTIPHSGGYDDFAQHCADFVAASDGGCHIWIIGNEPNLADERPGRGTLNEEVITPALYADCYRRCRHRIKQVPGHERDQVIVAAVGPWNPQTTYPGNPEGDWIKYFKDVLTALGDECDGIALHTYTHGLITDDQGAITGLLVTDETKPWPQWPERHFNFRAYQDFMQAIPSNMRHLPVYITETNQDDPWRDANTGWVQEAYKEINDWNRDPSHQKIRCLLLYRWSTADPQQRWNISRKRGVIDDFRMALQNDYRWF